MENKKYIIYLFIIICICFLCLGYFNYEKIVNFFNDREWEFAESFATINLENITQVEAGKSLLVRTNNELNLFGNDAKSEYAEDMVTTGLITSSCEDYIVIVPKDTNEIYLFKNSILVWKNEFNWNVLNVSVNKNGYVTVIYSQSGRKSCIKIFKPTGEELFTTYLGSTYALDVEMSYDNKMLYIAEIDTEGIKIKSNIKIIAISDLESGLNTSPKVETVLVGTDSLITDIEYNNSNKLYVLKDNGISVIDEKNNISSLGDFNTKSTLFASINHLTVPITIEKVSTGIFTNETILKIYKNNETIEVKIDKTPQNIDTMNDKIALNLGDEVLFLNTNGKVVKRYELENQLVSVKLYNKGSLAALVFRNRIELVKL